MSERSVEGQASRTDARYLLIDGDENSVESIEHVLLLFTQSNFFASTSPM